MKITLTSVSAVRKPAKPVKKAVRAPNRGAAKKPAAGAKKAPKKAKIPNSVQYLADKGKMRIRFAEPGRYILQGAKGTVVVMRVKQEMKYTPSVATKAFTATASDAELLQHIGAGDYAEPIELLQSESISYEADFLRAKGLNDLADKLDSEDELESESAAKAPGAVNKTAGQKMGRKTRAPNMMAPGWWVFIKPKTGKVSKEYVGPRISARRLLGIVAGEPVAKAKIAKAPAKVNDKAAATIAKKEARVERIKAQMAKTTNKEKKKALAQKARDINEQIRALKRTAKKKPAAKAVF